MWPGDGGGGIVKVAMVARDLIYFEQTYLYQFKHLCQLALDFDEQARANFHVPPSTPR